MAKMEEVKSVEESLRKLGHKRVDLPPDMDASDMGGTPPETVPMTGQQVVNLQSEPETPDTANVSDANTGEGIPEHTDTSEDASSTATTPENASEGHSEQGLTVEQLQQKLNDIEEKRRGWQSEAEKHKAELEKQRTEAELLRQVALQNRALNQFVGSQQAPQQPASPPEPDIKNYIPEDDLDVVTVADPRYQQYQRDLRQWESRNMQETMLSQFEAKQQQAQKQRMAEARARKLASEFPEFVDPLTKQPDYVKIQEWMSQFDNSGEDAWVQLRKFQDYYKTGQSESPANGKGSSIDPEQIERAAQAPTTVATAPQAATPEIKEVPAAIKKMGKTFGVVDLPPDFEGVL